MTRAVERWPCQTTLRRRHSRTLPQGDGRAGPAFTRRAVGSECNLIVLDACDVLDNAFAVGCPSIDAEGEVSSQSGHLRPLYPIPTADAPDAGDEAERLKVGDRSHHGLPAAHGEVRQAFEAGEYPAVFLRESNAVPLASR